MATDSFLQTSGGPQALNVYSANWQQVQGTFNIPNGTGDVRCTASGVDHLARYTAFSPAASQYAEVIPAAGWAASGRYIGPAVRVSATGDGYSLQATGGDWVIGRLNAGAWTSKASGTWTALDAQPLRLEVETIDASTVRVVLKRAGTTVATINDTDAARITAANSVGFGGYDAAGSDPGIADWTGDNLAGATSDLSGSSTPDVLVGSGTVQGGSTVSGTAAPDVLASTGTINSPNSLSGDASPDVLVSAGQVLGGSTIAGTAALDVLQASGTIAGGAGSGTFTTDPLARNNTTLAPNSPLTWLGFRVHATGAPVLLLTGQSTDASAVISVTHAALSPGTVYRADWLEASGEYGHWVAAAV